MKENTTRLLLDFGAHSNVLHRHLIQIKMAYLGAAPSYSRKANFTNKYLNTFVNIGTRVYMLARKASVLKHIVIKYSFILENSSYFTCADPMTSRL